MFRRYLFPMAALLVAAAGAAYGQCRPTPRDPSAIVPGPLDRRITQPILVQKVEPEYTAEAKEAQCEGTVLLVAVVGSDGKVHDAKVSRSLDAGLAQNAIAALDRWRFEPGRKNGRPVAVPSRIEIRFRLK